MSLLRGGSELLLPDTELALRSCSNRLRKQVCVQNDAQNSDIVHFVLNTVMQLLCGVGQKHLASLLTSCQIIKY